MKKPQLTEMKTVWGSLYKDLFFFPSELESEIAK